MEKILFIIDMQNDFIDGSLGSDDAKKIVPNVVKLIQNFQENNQIWYTKDTHYSKSNYFPIYENTLEGKMLPVSHCIIDTKGWKLNPLIADAINQYKGKIKSYIKTTFGSLDMISEAKLNLFDHPDSEDEIYICGLCTDICVISNALLLRAQFPNLRIFCYKDCCAGTSKEAHEAALKVMKSCQIEII